MTLRFSYFWLTHLKDWVWRFTLMVVSNMALQCKITLRFSARSLLLKTVLDATIGLIFLTAAKVLWIVREKSYTQSWHAVNNLKKRKTNLKKKAKYRNIGYYVATKEVSARFSVAREEKGWGILHFVLHITTETKGAITESRNHCPNKYKQQELLERLWMK